MTDESTDRAENESNDWEIGTAAATLRSSHRYKWLAGLLLFFLIGGGVLYWIQLDRRPGWDAISRNRAYAEFRILRGRRRTPRDPHPRQSEAEFQAFKASMAQLVKSDSVLAKALRKPVIAELQLLKRIDPPIENLKEQLEVDFPAEEFMRISLDAPNSKEAVAIVNAVYESFLQELVEVEQKERRARRKSLEDVRQSLKDKLSAKQTACNRLSERLATGNKETLLLRQQLELELLAELRMRHAEIQLELFGARTRLAIQEASGEPNDSNTHRQEVSPEQKSEQIPQAQQSLQQNVELLEIVAKSLDEEMNSQEGITKRRPIPSFELTTLKRQIEQIQVEVNRVSNKIQLLDIDIGMPRVRGYREATFRPEE